MESIIVIILISFANIKTVCLLIDSNIIINIVYKFKMSFILKN